VFFLARKNASYKELFPIESFPIPAACRSSTRRLKKPTLGVSVTDDDDDELLLQKSWPQLFRRSVSITSDEVASQQRYPLRTAVFFFFFLVVFPFFKP
jgi:hypothetical protein